MITKNDLREAIAECQGVRRPNASTCIKLAALLTIQRELYGSEEIDNVSPHSYSFSPGPGWVSYDGESEFSKVIKDRPIEEVWPVIDEMMETLEVINPRLYDGVIRKLRYKQ